MMMVMLMIVTRKPWYPSSPATACACLPVIPAGKPLEDAARNADRKQQEDALPLTPAQASGTHTHSTQPVYRGSWWTGRVGFLVQRGDRMSLVPISSR